MFIARRLRGPSKQLKHIIQIEHIIFKHPNWMEANQLAIYKRGWGFELADYKSVVSAETTGLRVMQARRPPGHGFY